MSDHLSLRRLCLHGWNIASATLELSRNIAAERTEPCRRALKSTGCLPGSATPHASPHASNPGDPLPPYLPHHHLSYPESCGSPRGATKLRHSPANSSKHFSCNRPFFGIANSSLSCRFLTSSPIADSAPNLDLPAGPSRLLDPPGGVAVRGDASCGDPSLAGRVRSGR